jgi:hypothetical protein
VTTPKKKRLLIPLNPAGRPNYLLNVVLFVLRAILGPIFFVVGKVNKLCFSSLDRAIGKKLDDKFAQEIKNEVSLLFTERNAKILSNEGKDLLRAF